MKRMINTCKTHINANNMKINWGHILTLVFIAFGSMIGWLVYRCSTTNSELVSNDYYKEELVYQQTIDGAESAGRLSGKMTVERQNDSIVLRFPKEMRNSSITGNAWFYCAADAHRDRRIALKPGPEAVQELSSHAFIRGNYIVKISWNSNNRFYYTERSIVIP